MQRLRLGLGVQNVAFFFLFLSGLRVPPRSQGTAEPRSHLPGKVRNIIQGSESPTALVPAATLRPGTVGEDTKGEGRALEPGRRDETEGRDAAQGEFQSCPHAARHHGVSVTWGSTGKISGGDCQGKERSRL